MTARKPADLADTVREGLSKPQALDGRACECETCRLSVSRLAALDALVAQAEDAEARAQRYKLDFLRARERAEAAEAVAEKVSEQIASYRAVLSAREEQK